MKRMKGTSSHQKNGRKPLPRQWNSIYECLGQFARVQINLIGQPPNLLYLLGKLIRYLNHAWELPWRDIIGIPLVIIYYDTNKMACQCIINLNLVSWLKMIQFGKLIVQDLSLVRSEGQMHHKATYLNILNNSSISESPGNNGRWLTISANIQPTDHTSTGVE